MVYSLVHTVIRVNTSSFAWINLRSLEQIYSRFSTSCQMIFFWGRITCSFCVWGLCLKESGSLGVKISGCATWLGTDLHFCFSANRVRKQLLHFAKRSWNDGGNDPFVSSPFIGFNAIRNPTCLTSMPRVMENFYLSQPSEETLGNIIAPLCKALLKWWRSIRLIPIRRLQRYKGPNMPD